MHTTILPLLRLSNAGVRILTGCGTQHQAWAFCGSYSLYAFCMGAAWPLIYVLTPKCLPAGVRATGVAVASTASKLGSVVQPQIAGHLLDKSMFAAGGVYTAGWVLSTGAAAYIAAAVPLAST